MSMLEDLFLEDEAGEAQELERVLEGGGDDYDERPLSRNSDDNEERDDEAVEDKRRVDPTEGKVKRVIRNPRFVLNPARLTGPRGIHVIPDHYKDFKFKGKGHEKEDLDMVLKKLEHWAYRLYPKFGFHDCLKKIETLGKKRTVMVHLKQIRSDQYSSTEPVVQQDSSDDEAPAEAAQEDEFDKLLQQQIEIARATPARAPVSTPAVDRSHMMPKATSSPSISEEQRVRMLRNRQLAEERRLARLRNDNSIPSTPVKSNVSNGTEEHNDVIRKHNKSNVIDSSDEDDATEVIKKPTNGHKTNKNQNSDEEMEVAKNRNVNSHNDFDSLVHIEGNDSNNINNENDVVVRRHNKSNVIDSSDEEDVAVVNESITVDVDVHSKVVNEEMDAAETDTLPANNLDSLITKNVEKDSEDEVNNEAITEEQNANQSKDQTKNEDVTSTNSSIINDQNDINRTENRNNSNEHTESNEIESNKIVAKENNTVSTANSDKENGDSTIAEEVMDVDFSDDF